MSIARPSPLMLLISAPSGAGKTTLCNSLLASCPNLRRAVTCTTRPPRHGEADAVDYYFLDSATFLRRVESGHFLEHANVYGHSYGTLKSEVVGILNQGVNVLLNVDVQGAESIRRVAQSDGSLRAALVTVFLTPPSLTVLEARLRKRATDTEEVIQRRLAVARQEASHWRHFDYLLISGTPEEDAARALTILHAEQMRALRAAAPQL